MSIIGWQYIGVDWGWGGQVSTAAANTYTKLMTWKLLLVGGRALLCVFIVWAAAAAAARQTAVYVLLPRYVAS